MIAAVATAIPTTFLELRDLPAPEPAEGELILEVQACGICGTDLHILDGESYRPETPFVLGHEPVGRVVAAGSTADRAWLGRTVTVTLFTGCGTCYVCRAGDERLCPDLKSITGVLSAPGGFAERLLVRTAHVVEVPDSLSPVETAGLVDAGATAANSVRVLGRDPDGPLVVVGAGPVGFLAAELATAKGWEVSVVQRSAARRGSLEALGYAVAESLADVMVRPTAVIDAAGSPPILPWALEALAPHGVFVAAAYGPLDPLTLAPVARKELRVVGVRSGSRSDLIGVLAAAASGTIRLPQATVWPLAEINAAFAALRGKTVAGKAVIVPPAPS